MPHDLPTEFPEQRFTQQLMRISTELQHGDSTDQSLLELFELLVQYGRESRSDPQTLSDHVARFSKPVGSLPNPDRLSILRDMLQDTQAQLRSRVLSVAERLEAHDAVQRANSSYGGLTQRKPFLQSPHALHHPS